MRTMTRTELAFAVTRELGLSQNESSRLVETLIEEVSETLGSGEPVKIANFGVFSVRHKRQRLGRNPKTGKEVQIAPRRVVSFRASQALKVRLKNKT